jgi:hypothetical protein
MARAGHSDFKTTQAYIDLAGGDVPRGSGAARAKALGPRGLDQLPVPSPDYVAKAEHGPVAELWKEPLRCRPFPGYGAAQESEPTQCGAATPHRFEATSSEVHFSREAGFSPRFRPLTCAEMR